MAYVFGLPRDVTDLIYSFRDPLNWNGDKYRSTPLGALFKSGHLEIIREPLAPYFQYWRGVIYQIEDFPDDFLTRPTLLFGNGYETVPSVMQSSPVFCLAPTPCGSAMMSS